MVERTVQLLFVLFRDTGLGPTVERTVQLLFVLFRDTGLGPTVGEKRNELEKKACRHCGGMVSSSASPTFAQPGFVTQFVRQRRFDDTHGHRACSPNRGPGFFVDRSCQTRDRQGI
jgi:hypothetical protein